MTTFILVDDVHVDETSGFADLAIRLSEASTQRITVQYANGDGLATRDADYGTVLGTASFEPGITSRTVRVPIINDSQAEPLETFQFLLSNAINATLARRVATIFVHDNDRLSGSPFVSMRDLTVDEADGQAAFTVVLDRPAAGPVEITYTTDAGNAESGVDFVPVSGTLRFEPGQVIGTVRVPIINDNLVESDERFSLVLKTSAGAVLVDTIAYAVIAANDQPAVLRPSLRVFADPVGEADTYADVIVQLSGPSTQPVTINLATSSLWQGANSGTDYAGPQAYSIVLMPGQTSAHLPFLLLNDAVAEPLESILINASIAGDATQGTLETLVFVYDDDAERSTPVLVVHDMTVDEHDGMARFTVALSQPTTSTVTVDWATQAGTAQAGQDYFADSGRLSFAPGQQVQTLLVPILDDTLTEGDEFFSVAFSGAAFATLPMAAARAIIGANDAPAVARPLAQMKPMVIDENDGYAEFAITLSAPGTELATLRFAASGLTASSSDLYPVGTVNTANATLSFEPGRTVRTIRIPIIDDSLVETVETLQVVLSNPISLDLATDRELIALYDNDAPPGAPMVSINDVYTSESDGLARLAVTLDRPSAVPVYVAYSSAGSSATSDSDFIPISGILSFAPGEISQTLYIALIDDGQPEPLEVFNVLLGVPSSGLAADATGSVSIARSDLPVSSRPNLTVDQVRVAEYEPWVDVVLRLDRPAAAPITLTYSTSNVTASSPGDFRATFGPVSFAPGSTSASVRFALVDDRTSEASETFSFNLVPNAAVNLLTVNTLITIVDDDAAGGQFVFGAPQIDRREGNAEGTMVVEVERLGNRSLPASVTWAVLAGAADADDFTGANLPGGRLDFAAGQTSQLISFGVAGDIIFERHEDFSVALSSPSGASLASASLAGRLQNDDPLPRNGVPALGRDGTFLFDPVFYLWKYPALATTISLGAASTNYLVDGAAQGRQPNAWFDATWYGARWPDLTPLNLSNATLFQHFNLFGVWEGRAPGPTFERFDGNRYLGDNPDVAAYVDGNVADFLGSRSNGAIAHYIIYGAAEQRLSFDTTGQPVVLDYLLG